MIDLQNLYKKRALLMADSIDHDTWNHFGKLHKFLHNDAPKNNPIWPTIRWGIDCIQACRHPEMNETWVREALNVSDKIAVRRKWLKYNTTLSKGQMLAKELGIQQGMPRLKEFERVYRTDKIELIGLKTKYDPTRDVSEPVLAVMPSAHLAKLKSYCYGMRSLAHNDKSGNLLAIEQLEATADEDYDVFRIVTFITNEDGLTQFHKHYAASYDLPVSNTVADTTQLFAMVKTRKNLDQRLSTIANKWLKAMDTPYSWSDSYIYNNDVSDYIAKNLGRMIHYSELALIRKTVYAGYKHDSFEVNAMLATLQSNS